VPKAGNVNLDFSSISSISTKTGPQLFVEGVQKEGDKVAFYYKHQGIYEGVSWQEYKEHVENICLGLLELGLQRGDRVAIMGDSCPEWFYADIGVMSAGAISCGVYSTSSPNEVEYLIENAGARFFVAENQEYVDKILPSIDRWPRLEKIIVADTRAMFAYSHPKLMSLIELEELGKQRKSKEPHLFEKLVAQGRPDDVACLIYTSGTGGKSKGAMRTHRNLNVTAYSLLEVFPKLLTHEHRIITHLSLGHALERMCCMSRPILLNVTPYIGERVEFLQETLQEVQPNFFQGVPRIWEKMAAQLVVSIHTSSWLKRKSYQWAMHIGRRYRQMCWEGKDSFIWRILYWIACAIVFRRMLHKVGLRKTKYGLSSGAPLPPVVQSLWQIWGVNLINYYGSTEGGHITSQRPGFPKPGDVGEPSSINRCRLADDGEVLISGPGVFPGYWNDDEATRGAIEDGWHHVGEIALFENGKLKIIDRKTDMMTTAGGKNITPAEIELALKGSPYVSEAILVADMRKFPSALIEINYDTVSEWARKNKVLYAGYTSLATHPEVYKLIAEEIASANRLFARVEQVKKFRIIPKELDPEEEDTTPTRKIKRKHIYELFKDLIDEMYGSEEEELLEAEVKMGSANPQKGHEGHEIK
jgi:long-chain acyl-CoA synthetase